MPGQPDAAELIDALPLRDRIARQLGRFLHPQRAAPPKSEDARRFPRFYLRAAAALELSLDIAGAMPQGRNHASRLSQRHFPFERGFVHSEQLFPCECLEMLLADGTHWFVTVVRCQKRHERCYEVAAMLSATPV